MPSPFGLRPRGAAPRAVAVRRNFALMRASAGVSCHAQRPCSTASLQSHAQGPWSGAMFQERVSRASFKCEPGRRPAILHPNCAPSLPSFALTTAAAGGRNLPGAAHGWAQGVVRWLVQGGLAFSRSVTLWLFATPATSSTTNHRCYKGAIPLHGALPGPLRGQLARNAAEGAQAICCERGRRQPRRRGERALPGAQR